MCPVWLLVAAVVVGVSRGAVGQCWEHPSCQELNSESSMMECLQLCRSDLTAETPIFPGNAHLQPPPPSDPSFFILPSSSSSSPQAKRSYSMEHFRWGKPVGRKRRPVKVYTSNSVEEESAEVFPGEMRRRELAKELLAAGTEEQQKGQEVTEEEQQQQLVGGAQEKKDGPYKMKHFRWSSPPASKRYGGFMKSWDERSQRPLLTLFRNVINKDGQQQK
ncbi:pro-opiomelanocortin [Mastacembelus armatus]|uniref:Proopiomelanocortin n=1 Tax=Mastacembelus armatus TaxID=205130 RepID=A0A3Q3N0Y3_9TELE|nr:pro-opiomelanocortin [Mastacembelus armatus]XP_026157792.1 pro-opiomelanocortin [Mastacembelus armatus]XP_033181467.1 pro-opiomelanocortin [Mastacembelus armatus]XP_033181468.1 pro-opiomelanocortin [Mastacembelus armatus]